MIPVEFYIVGVVAALYSAAWALDKFRGWLCRRQGKVKEAEHVLALGVQLYLAKDYEPEKCFLLMNNTQGSRDTRPVKASRRPR